MIPTKPPPTFRNSDSWSPQFIDFVSRCLVKTPEKRATASELLHSDFIGRNPGWYGTVLAAIKKIFKAELYPFCKQVIVPDT
jgi:serine/threonine protein kinase